MREFYEALNSWDKKNRLDRWAVYRSQITDFVLSSAMDTKEGPMDADGHNKPRLLIIGAGGCEDIGLRDLQEAGYDVTLSDIDLAVMEEALVREDLLGVKLWQLDYLRLEESGLIDAFEDLCKGGAFFGDLADAAEQILQVASNASWGSNDRFDLVICLPIYTQLLFFYMSELLNNAYAKGLIDAEAVSGVQQLLLEGMPEVISRFNDNMISRLTRGGRLTVFSDLIEDKPDGPYTESFEDGLTVSGVIDAYVAEYGMGLGNYGLYDMSDKMTEIAKKWFLWPFSEERCMIVEGISYYR